MPLRCDHIRGYAARLLALLSLCAVVSPCAGTAATADNDLLRQVEIEQKKAGERRASLTRLTEQERRMNTGLAAAEDSMLQLEANLAAQEERLRDLAQSDAVLQRRFAAQTQESERTESAMAEVLRVLWEMHARQISAGGRELPDWHVTDRDYAWSLELFASLDVHRKQIAAQRAELKDTIMRRETLGKEVADRFASLSREKERLLLSRVQFMQQLGEVRRQKRDAETQLQEILELVRTLNLRIEQSGAHGDFESSKGGLPWPAKGVLQERFNPAARPPVQGVTLGLPAGTEICAVHWGKVVHNDIVRGKGRVVILLHGSDYYSIYAYLAESLLAVGQNIDRMGVLGKAGYVPALEGSGVYFEVRFHQKAMNPELWCSVE